MKRTDSSIEAIRKSGGRLGEVGIPEMIDYLRKIGYKVCAFATRLWSGLLVEKKNQGRGVEEGSH